MEPARWKDIDALLQQALSLPTVEQEAFLKRACGRDRELYRQALTLWRAGERGVTFLDRPVEPPRSPLKPDSRIGAYRILREIGQGGMGTVYLAERADGNYRKRVALKVLKGALGSDRFIRRFQAERQILANLDHAHIARLYEGGTTPSGLPYFAMEWVDGLPITQYCDRQRLTVDERLRLFRKVCNAVQFAHQNLVVHRDLKPANILVTTDGEPKLLDFGIARMLQEDGSHAEGTQTGPPILTPQYACPEQIAGEAVTTAADVYALGVVLFEMLTGARPFEMSGFNLAGLYRAITEAGAPRLISIFAKDAARTESGPSGKELTHVCESRRTRPAMLRRQLSGDLDKIVRKALRPHPAERYSSAESLSQDLERYTGGFPVEARDGAAFYLLGKFFQRHRWAVIGGVVLALVTLNFVGALVIENERTRAARLLAESERDRSNLVSEFLIGVFNTADPFLPAGENLSPRELLDRAAHSLPGQLRQTPRAGAALQATMGRVYANLGESERAVSLLEKARDLPSGGSRESRLQRAEIQVQLGLAYLASAKWEQAEEALKQGFDTASALLGSKHPTVAGYRLNLAKLYQERGDYGAAADLVDIAVGNLESEPGFLARVHLAEGLNQLAVLRFRQGRFPEILPLLKRCLALKTEIYGETHPEVGRTLDNLGLYYKNSGNLDAAIGTFRRALALRESTLGPQHPQVAFSLNNLALTLQMQRDYAGAEPLFERALGIMEKFHGGGHPLTVKVRANLAGIYMQKGELEKAENLYGETLARLEASLGPDHPDLCETLENLAIIHTRKQEWDRAEDLFERALTIRRDAQGPEHPLTARTLQLMAELFLKMGRTEEGLAYCRQALAIRESVLGPDHPDAIASRKLCCPDSN